MPGSRISTAVKLKVIKEERPCPLYLMQIYKDYKGEEIHFNNKYICALIIVIVIILLVLLPWIMLDDWLYIPWRGVGGGRRGKRKAFCTLPHNLTSGS
jgi:hypothetical protein